ncbi:MAG: ArsR/SmtB family transcription factor [Mycobacteriales bacterium]
MRTVGATQNAIGSRAAKVALFDALAEVAEALAAGRRLEIVDLLAQGERCVDEVAREIAQSVANTSHHLRRLVRAGLLRSRRDGTRVYYRLAGVEVEELWAALRLVAAIERDDLPRLAVTYIGPSDERQILSRGELLKRLRAGAVTVVDVRPLAEYRAGHVPGALSLPPDRIGAALAELPKDLPVVAYCRGPLCAFAPAALRLLRSAGFQVLRLEEGLPEWRRAGLPVAVGDTPGAVDMRPLLARSRHRDH